MCSKLKLIFKILLSYIRCIFFKQPLDCIIEGKVKLKNTILEGKNKIGKGAQIYYSNIGYGTFIGPECSLIRCNIGRFSAIAAKVQLIYGEHPTHSFVSIHPAFYSAMGQYGFTYVDKTKFQEFKYVDYDKKYHLIIGNDVWIGADVRIVEGVKIGDGAIIGAGAVVTKDVPPYSIVVGVPAKIIRYRFNDDDIKFLLNLKWWKKNDTWIKGYIDEFDNIDRFRMIIQNNQSTGEIDGIS